MPPVVQHQDQNDLVPSGEYPTAHFPFADFNPIQSRIHEIYDQDINCLIAASTSSGKTVCAEMFLSHEVNERGGKGMYLAPLRALAQEKIDDWCDDSHHFVDQNLSICTGDYRLTAARKKELENSNLILMTSEMLNSRCRNFASEHNEWIEEVGTLVIDESHLLTVPGRGDHLEAGLMKFSHINPNARIIMLSATMPNCKEIAEWVSYTLTKRETHMLESTYRPCPLNVHYEQYCDSAFKYDAKEQEKINAAMLIIEDYPEDKFLVFVHTKRTGRMMAQQLKRHGIKCEYHNADVDLKNRVRIAEAFKSDADLRVIVATSTLAWGLNLPARRVVVLGVHRGLGLVDTYDIAQEVGRAGRPKFDKMGDAYVLLPESEFYEQKERIETPQRIVSQMLDDVGGRHKILAFHLVSEIHHGGIKTEEDVHNWFSRSLAAFQNQELEDEIVEGVLELLLKCGAIREEEGIYKCNAIGKIASMFYFSPFDIAALRRNFSAVFEAGSEDNDLWTSFALGNTDTNRTMIVSRAEREEMATYQGLLKQTLLLKDLHEPSVKAGFAYYQLLTGRVSDNLAGVARNFQMDFPRVSQVLNALDGMSSKWKKGDFFKKLSLRVIYGVRAELVYLCQIPNIGRVRAEKLFNAGLRNADDVYKNPDVAKRVLNMKEETINKVLEDSRAVALAGDNSL